MYNKSGAKVYHYLVLVYSEFKMSCTSFVPVLYQSLYAYMSCTIVYMSCTIVYIECRQRNISVCMYCTKKKKYVT